MAEDGDEPIMDSRIAEQLVDKISGLTTEVVRLRTSFDIFGPMLDSQVHGLTQLANEQTKLMTRLEAVEARMAEDRESRRWMTAQILVAAGAVTAIVQVLIGMVGHK